MAGPRFDEAGFYRLIRGETTGLRARAARAGLWCASLGYRLGVAARNLAYDRGWGRTRRVGVPVVSVGNLTVGGTGKTPTVEWVARWYRRRGRRVAILSRGYGHGPTEGLNDEGRVLEDNLPDVPHLQNPDRVALAFAAAEELEAELLVLDDGFQHRRLARDLDIVLLDALDPFGLGHVLPRGLLREPPTSLRRAGLVVLSRADLVDAHRRSATRARADRYAGRPLPWVEARHAPRDLVDADGQMHPLSYLEGQRVVAFCGIGNPEGFRRTLEQLGVMPFDLRIFPDHHVYGRTDLDTLTDWARRLGAEVALTTQKDFVKLRTSRLGPARLLALRIGLEVLEGQAVLEGALGSLVLPQA